jgi:hypothetical protein
MRALPLVLTACLSAPTALPQAPPPASLRVHGLVRGHPGVVQLQHPGLQGRRAHLVLGAEGPGAGPCPPALGGACFGVLNPTRVASVVGDPTGLASFRFAVPGWSELVDEIHLQVVAEGPQPWLSPVSAAPLLWGNQDWDRDGLEDGVEADLGLDATRKDSDGGGTQDYQELRVDRTDPLSRADDLTGERVCFGGRSEDGDRDVDCDDPDCATSPVCPERRCTDGVDNNHDSLVDCAEPACRLQPACAEPNCGDGRDEDRDGLADCADPDCYDDRCHTRVLVWAIAGEGQLSIRRHPGDTADTAAAAAPPETILGGTYNVFGRAWVDSPRFTEPRLCDVLLSSQQVGAFPAMMEVPFCELSQPLLSWSYEWSAATQVVTAAGVPFLTPVGGIGADVDPDPRRVALPFVAAGAEPVGSCGGAAPIRSWFDRDGDGYGVSDTQDVYGLPGGLVWSCAPVPGTVSVGGDCDDEDPTLHPATLTLAPGKRCADSQTDDRDADGTFGAHDADDHDGTRQ